MCHASSCFFSSSTRSRPCVAGLYADYIVSHYLQAPRRRPEATPNLRRRGRDFTLILLGIHRAHSEKDRTA